MYFEMSKRIIVFQEYVKVKRFSRRVLGSAPQNEGTCGSGGAPLCGLISTLDGEQWLTSMLYPGIR